MAKSSAPTPARSHGYGKILGCTLVAILGGILLLCLEMNEYGWQREVKADPALKIPPLPPPEPAGAKPPAPAPVPAPMNPMGNQPGM